MRERHSCCHGSAIGSPSSAPVISKGTTQGWRAVNKTRKKRILSRKGREVGGEGLMRYRSFLGMTGRRGKGGNRRSALPSPPSTVRHRSIPRHRHRLDGPGWWSRLRAAGGSRLPGSALARVRVLGGNATTCGARSSWLVVPGVGGRSVGEFLVEGGWGRSN